MKLALLSDIHSNRQALDACMSHARAQGAERFAWQGELVGYGADPGYVVRQAMALVAAGHCVIGGNHDALAVHPPKPGDRAASTVAAYGAQWTHEQLTPQERAFLAARPWSPRSAACCWHMPAQTPPSAGLMWTTKPQQRNAWTPQPGAPASAMCFAAMCTSKRCTSAAPGAGSCALHPSRAWPFRCRHRSSGWRPSAR